jgi:hypothetical protein
MSVMVGSSNRSFPGRQEPISEEAGAFPVLTSAGRISAGSPWAAI